MSEQTAHAIYAASVRQLNGVIAERDALVIALAAKQAQVDGLLAERAILRAEIDELRTANTDPFDLACLDDGTAYAFEVSAVTDDGAEEES